MMNNVHVSSLGRTTLVAQLCLPATTVQVLSFDLVSPANHALREESFYRLDLSLNERLAGSVLCFADRWPPDRYERPGRLFLLPPRETLRIRSGIGQQNAIICHLSLERLKGWLEHEPSWSDRRLEACIDIPSAAIGSLLIGLGEEARHPGFGSDVVSEALAVQIAVMLERYYRSNAEQPVIGTLSPRHLRLIDERLQEQACAPTLTELAVLCGLSVRQISRGFRASRGISLGAHVANLRIQVAKQLLEKGSSVKAVAYDMGFSSPSSFSYAFRQITGHAPSTFSRQTDQKEATQP